MQVRSTLIYVLMLLPHSTHATPLLEILTQDVSTMPEYPQARKIWGNTDFTEFHKRTSPSFLFSFLDAWGYRSGRFFTIQYFQESLKKAVATKQPAKIAVRIRCVPNSKLIIVGSLRGNFHRLIRTLTWLHQHDFIDADLRIRNTHDYLLLSGYAINGSAYSLETLTLILELMNRNPNNFFLLRSRQEMNNHWNDFSLKREINVRTTLDKDMLVKDVNRLFDSLPKTAYVCIDTDPNDFIKITSNTDEEDMINESELSNFFDPNNQEPIVYFYEDQKNKETKAPNITVRITTENLHLKSQNLFGLVFMEQNLKTSFWSLFPALTPNDTTAVSTIIDSFVAIDLKESLETSLISFWQKKNPNTDFTQINQFNLVAGIPEHNKKSDLEPITIGSTMSLINGVPHIGTEIKQGMIARINSENKQGGIQGRFIKSSIYNDDYLPNLALKNIQTLVADSVNMILFPVGSPTLALYFHYLQDGLISVFFPVTGASLFRMATVPDIIHLRASYDDEIHFLLEHLIKTVGAKKFAFFYQEDAYGIGSAQTAHKKLKNLHDISSIDLAYTRGEINFETQIKKIKEYQPDAIGFFSTSPAARLLILQMGINECINKYFFATSFIADKSFRFFLKNYGLNFLCSSVVPNPATSQLPIAQEYRKAMDEIKKPYDRFSFESYVGTSLFIEVAKKIKGKITRQSIMSALESLHDYYYKGLIFNFNPQTRSLAHSIWLEANDSQEWIEKKIDDISEEQIK